MSVAQVFAHPHHGLIQRQARFHANDGEIKGIGHAEADPRLAGSIMRFRTKRGRKKPRAVTPSSSGGDY